MSQIKPMPVWQSIVCFGVPIILGVIGMYVLLPALDRIGVPMILNYMLSMVSMFPLLLCLSLIALKIEVGKISWSTIKERFRLHPLSKETWLWTFGLCLVYVGGQVLLLPTSSWLASVLPLPIPDSLPPAIDPRVVKSAIPTEMWDIPLLGNWKMALLYVVLVLLNIISEEFWWRGYILPRQELQHGKYAWLLHGLFWTLFHLPFWWNIISLLPATLSLSYVVSKTKNTIPGIIVHLVMNGLGFVIMLMGVIGVGV